MGRVYRDQVGRSGEQVAEMGRKPVEDSCRGGGGGWGIQGYLASSDPVALELE
jgi:hypothetical protein